MKALTLTQPWATLIAIGAKTIETRGWNTSYRGPVAIHAAKGFPLGARETCHDLPFGPVLRAAEYTDESELPRGAVIALAELADVFRFDHRTWFEVEGRAQRGELPLHESDFGDFGEDRYGFVLANVRPLKRPLYVRGMLALWTVPNDIIALIDDQLREIEQLAREAPE